MAGLTAPTSSGILTKSDLEREVLSGSAVVEFFAAKETKNPIWSNFVKIKYNGINQPFVKCISCHHLVTYKSQTGTGGLQRHSCFKTSSSPLNPQKPYALDRRIVQKIPPNVIDQLHQKQLRFLTRDLRSLDSTNGEGFMDLAQSLINIGAQFGYHDASNILTSDETLTRTILPRTYYSIKQDITDVIKNNELAFTIDEWTEHNNHRHYLTLTCHYIDEQFEMQTYVLGTRGIVEEKTKENIRKLVTNILSEYTENFEQVLKSAFFVTNNNYDMVSAFNPYQRLSCMCLNVNLVMQEVFHFEDDQDMEGESYEKNTEECLRDSDISCENEIAHLIKASKSLVRYIKEAGFSKLLKKTLKGDLFTRWDSIYLMLSNILEAYDELNNILSEKRQLHLLNGINLKSVVAVVSFCKIFTECSNSLSANDRPTIHEIVLWNKKLLNFCSNTADDSNVMKTLKSKALSKILERFQLHSLFYVALFLDPKFRKLKVLNDQEKEDTMRNVKRMLVEIYNKEDGHSHTSKKRCLIIKEENDIFKEFMDDSDTDSIESVDAIVDTEIKLYLSKRSGQDGRILDFWKSPESNGLQYLKMLARKVLNIPASSATSERVFSISDRMLEQKRVQLLPENVDKILFLHKNWKNDQLLYLHLFTPREMQEYPSEHSSAFNNSTEMHE